MSGQGGGVVCQVHSFLSGLVYEVKALDPYGVMGSGIHERKVVNSQYLTMKAFVKKEK